MRKVSTVLAALSLAVLSACGGSDSGAANNSVEDVNVASDDLTVTENLGAVDSLGNEANALGSDAGNLGNAADANVTDAGNALENSAANSQ
jgi:hypothetical protein